MNKKIFIMPVLMCGLISAAFANIDRNAETADCDTETLGVVSGPTTMEARWLPNTVNITWYDGNTVITPDNEGATTCEYDEAMTLPGNTLTREGYTFAGWTFRGVECGANHLNVDTDGTDYYSRVLDNNTYYCNTNGVAASSNWCEDVTFSENFRDMSAGEWKTTFSYGNVKGVASCNATQGSSYFSQDGYNYMNDAVSAASMTPGADDGVYCWCKLTEVKGTRCGPEFTKWVYLNQHNTNCNRNCPAACASFVRTDSAFRTVIFGQD